jgi:nitroreductase
MDIYEAIKTRRSVRKYKGDAIPEDVLDRVLDAMRLAPSGCNFQPWKFVVVKDEKIRQALVPSCRDQGFIAQAPVIIVGCGWEKRSYQHMGNWGTSAVVDVTIALDHLTLAAASEGLGTCWIGAFDEKEVRGILGIPSDVRVVALTPLGYPEESPSATPRKNLDEILCEDGWRD